MKYYFILFLIMIFSSELFAWEIRDKRQFGPYSIFIEHDEEWLWHRVTIKKNHHQIYQLKEVGHYFNIGNEFSEKEKGPYEIKDINKNGIPDLIISENAMGTVCCHILHVIELGKNIKDTKLEAGNNSIRFIDFDKDGIDEIEFWDNVIVGVFASTAGSPLGRVVYRYDRTSNNYKIAPKFMHKNLEINWLNKQKKLALSVVLIVVKKEGLWLTRMVIMEYYVTNTERKKINNVHNHQSYALAFSWCIPRNSIRHLDQRRRRKKQKANTCRNKIA